MEEKVPALTRKIIDSFMAESFNLSNYCIEKIDDVFFVVVDDDVWPVVVGEKKQPSESVEISGDGFVLIKKNEFDNNPICWIEHEIVHVHQYRKGITIQPFFSHFPKMYPNFFHEMKPYQYQLCCLSKKKGNMRDAVETLISTIEADCNQEWQFQLFSLWAAMAELQTEERIDSHVHCGQFEDIYYSPEYVIKSLSNNGIKKCLISSTTACILGATAHEREQLLNFIDVEIDCAVKTGIAHGLCVLPLFWVVPEQYSTKEFLSYKIENLKYRGFKIHPDAHAWNVDDYEVQKVMENVCSVAYEQKVPILIHCGDDEQNLPYKFEKWFCKYPGTLFILAHCKDPYPIERLFRKYDNLLGDVAFCSKDSYDEMCKSGFSDRLLFGTDFPITHWYQHFGEELRVCTTEELTKSYKQTLTEMKWFKESKKDNFHTA